MTQDIEEYNRYLTEQFAGYNSYIRTWIYEKFMHCPLKFLCFFTGNKWGKTIGVAHGYAERVLSRHPIPRKNVLYFTCTNDDEYSRHEFSPRDMKRMFPRTGPLIELRGDEECPNCKAPIEEVKRKRRVIRFASGILPMEGEDAYHKNADKGAESDSLEVKNVQYPAFKDIFPPYLIYKDPTTRVKNLVLHDVYERGHIIIEFTSFKQSLITKTGQSVLSFWGDEQMSEEECSDAKARVVFEKGDIVLTCTPIPTPSSHLSFYYNEFYEKARIYYRTQKVADKMTEVYGRTFNRLEETDSNMSCAVFQASSYDNPMIDHREVDELLMTHDDPVMNDIKIFGLFKQLSGKIFPMFDYHTHCYQDEFDPFAIPGRLIA